MINYSIILPHYNSLDVLNRAVSSVPDRKDIEVFVIDNSQVPIDNRLLENRSNVKILYSTVGKGAGAARNVGLKHASGKWLLMLDADDFFTPNAFSIFDKYLQSDADIIFFNITSCDSITMEPSTRSKDYNKFIEKYCVTQQDESLRYNWTSPWGKMIRNQLIQDNQITFDETMASNDVMFSLKSGFYAKQIDASSDIVYCVTDYQGSLTMTHNMRNLTDRVSVLAEYNNFIKINHLPKKYLKSIMFYIYTAYKNHGVVSALRLFGISFKKKNNPLIGMTRWINTYNSLTA